MIHASLFIDECKKNGYDLFSGTPCSYLRPFINYVIEDSELEFVETTNEGDAVALASGAWLGGRKSVVMFQNSGLGNAVNPLSSLSYTMKIPFLGIVTLRGEPGGAADEPQHDLMGKITTDLLEKLQIPWEYFPTKADDVKDLFEKARRESEEKKVPFFFVMKKGSVEGYELGKDSSARGIAHYESEIHRLRLGNIKTTRTDALRAIRDNFSSDDILLGTTGKTGRELFELGDTPNQLYMVGSMGCILPLGIGLKKAHVEKNICVIDGDGALMMRLGNMAFAGQSKLSKLVHILLDNGVHDSTGGQKSFSESTDFPLIAKACGYQEIYDVDDLKSFEKALVDSINSEKLCFIRFTIKPGSPKDLGRPTITPVQVAERMRAFIGKFK